MWGIFLTLSLVQSLVFSPERPQVQPSPLGQSPWGRSSPAKSRRCANRRGRGRGRGRDGLSRGRHYTRLSLPAVLTQRSGWALKPGDVEREREHDGRGSPLLSFLAKQTQRTQKRGALSRRTVSLPIPQPWRKKETGQREKGLDARQGGGDDQSTG